MNRPIATITVWLGFPPSLALLILIASGTVRLWEGIAGLIGCMIWSIAVGVVLARDLRRFSTSIASENPGDINLFTPGLTRLAQATLQTLAAERRSRQNIATDASASQALLERLPDALFQFDGTRGARRVMWRNPAAVGAYGTEESALLRHPSLRAALAEAETSDEPIRTTFALAAPVARDLDATVIRTGTITQAAPLYLLLTDRTHERSLDRMRADFVANASHELRTPLTSLIGFIETLQGPALGDAEALPRFLKIMAEQAGRMQRIIADLLSLSHIEMTEHQPPAERVDLGALLRQIAGFMDPILREGRTTLALDIPNNLPPVRGDAGQLTQVFGNLIDNAIKYSALKHSKGGGTINLDVNVTPSASFPLPGLLISVTDDGPGIAREHLPRLTERFYRADKGRSRAVGGTGLGLAIVKHVVSRHRGRLIIESIEGEGTTCRVWLPLAGEAARAVPERPQRAAREG
ncbi:MAG: ATP-binding protein [Acidiphilium sp.]|nr:ATP-binding protein [Acidiphilium sp.]MDD4934901.1 ATP-binding protein [Acidiphilium sp.]